MKNYIKALLLILACGACGNQLLNQSTDSSSDFSETRFGQAEVNYQSICNKSFGKASIPVECQSVAFNPADPSDSSESGFEESDNSDPGELFNNAEVILVP